MTGQELWASLLQEAIQGRLVEQRDDEPPVEQMGNAPEDVPFAIPEKWKWRKLKDLFNFIDYRGKTPKKSVDGIRLMTASNVKKGYIDHTRIEYISKQEYAERQSRGISKKGDILFTTEAPLGNVAIADLDIYSAGQRIITLQSSKVDKKLFMYFLLSEHFQDVLQENATGTTAKGIKAARLKEIYIPLPPLAEQRRIVARLEELRPLVDGYGKAAAELTSMEAELPDKLRASLLQEAISGRLVEQRDDEQSEDLEEKREYEPPFSIPNNWKWVYFDMLIDIISGTSYNKNDVVKKGVRIIRGGNIRNFSISLKDDDVFVSNLLRDGNKVIRKYDIVIVASTGSKDVIGRPGEYIGNEEVQIGAFLRIIRPKIQKYSNFIKIILMSDYYRNYIRGLVKGTNINNIKNEYINSLLIPLPPLAEQRRIVARLEELLPEVARLVG